MEKGGFHLRRRIKLLDRMFLPPVGNRGRDFTTAVTIPAIERHRGSFRHGSSGSLEPNAPFRCWIEGLLEASIGE
jgi:hypothetical protein